MKSRSIARLIATPILACAIAGLGGCAAAVPLVSAATAGASAGEVGYKFWKSGVLTYVDEGSVGEMNEAMAITIDRLALIVHETRDDTKNGVLKSRWWSIRSDRGHLVTLKVEPLTAALIIVEIDAGMFGNRAAAEMIANRLKQELDTLQSGGTSPGRHRPLPQD